MHGITVWRARVHRIPRIRFRSKCGTSGHMRAPLNTTLLSESCGLLSTRLAIYGEMKELPAEETSDDYKSGDAQEWYAVRCGEAREPVAHGALGEARVVVDGGTCAALRRL